MNSYEAWDKKPNANNIDHPEFNHFYRRFEAELEIRDLAIKFAHSYHLGLFMT